MDWQRLCYCFRWLPALDGWLPLAKLTHNVLKLLARWRLFEHGIEVVRCLQFLEVSGDDEDEELGNIMVARQRSPKRSSAKRSSKLGTEMMRTNSQGSVISVEDVMTVQKDAKASAMPSAPTSEPILEEPAAEVEATGRLTPPETTLPALVGGHIEVIQIDAAGNEIQSPELRPELEQDPEATPKPTHTGDPDPDPTPRATGSPSPHPPPHD